MKDNGRFVFIVLYSTGRREIERNQVLCVSRKRKRRREDDDDDDDDDEDEDDEKRRDLDDFEDVERSSLGDEKDHHAR